MENWLAARAEGSDAGLLVWKNIRWFATSRRFARSYMWAQLEILGSQPQCRPHLLQVDFTS